MPTWMRWILMWAGVSILASFALVALDTVLLQARAIPNEPGGLRGLGAALGYNLVWFMKALILFVAIALLVAFGVAETIARFLPVRLRTLALAFAGLLALPVLFWAMKQAFFGVDILAGARTWVGYAVQAVVTGAGSGALFGWLTRRKRRSRYAVG